MLLELLIFSSFTLLNLFKSYNLMTGSSQDHETLTNTTMSALYRIELLCRSSLRSPPASNSSASF